jgi:exopolysaccharide biosynthesis polyprenyl glycosylphosphotransferase
MIRIFRVFFPASILALLISEAALILFCLVLVSLWVNDLDPEFYLIEQGGLMRMSFVVMSMLAGLYFQDLYNNLRVRSRLLLLQQISMAIGISFLFQALLTYIDPDLMLPRWVMIYGAILMLVLLPAWRLAFLRLALSALGQVKILFVGGSSVLVEIAERIAARPELGLQVIGYLEDADGDPFESTIPKLGGINEVSRVAAEVKPDRIVVGMSERRARMPVYDLLDLRLSGILVVEASALYESTFGRVSTRDLRPSQLIFSSELGPAPGSVAIQAIYSWLLALVGLIVLSPVMLIVALLVRLTSQGPILHRQTRVGLNDAPFTVLKFRSMYANAEARTGAVWAKKNDPRITPIGRYLRLFRLDELPQFFNVLKGEMSFVGPRPERPEFVKALSEKIPFYRQRHFVKPGITGWAQINHKYGDTVEDTITKLEYDLYYIKHISPSLDVYIVLNTLKTVVLGRGAQ